MACAWNRRLGVFEIGLCDLCDNKIDPALSIVFSKVIPIHIEYDFCRSILKYTAISDEFEMVPLGYPAIKYKVVITTHKGSECSTDYYSVEFIKDNNQG